MDRHREVRRCGQDPAVVRRGTPGDGSAGSFNFGPFFPATSWTGSRYCPPAGLAMRSGPGTVSHLKAHQEPISKLAQMLSNYGL